MREAFSKTNCPKSVEYVDERRVGDIRCNKCGQPVLRSDVDGYTYQCMNCCEDMYSFEANIGAEITEEEMRELYEDVFNLLLLDEQRKARSHFYGL